MNVDPIVRQTWLLAYDIRRPARLRRVHKYLSGLAHALQYSVFVADLNASELVQMKEELKGRADAKADDIRVYCLSRNVRGNWFGAFPRDGDVVIYGSGAACLVENLVENPLDRPARCFSVP